MRVQKGFSRLEMCFNIQCGMMMGEIAFVYRNVVSEFEISAVNLIVG